MNRTKPPHPATLSSRERPPHPATVAQRARGPRERPPHPATVAQRPGAPGPHPATIQRQSPRAAPGGGLPFPTIQRAAALGAHAEVAAARAMWAAYDDDDDLPGEEGFGPAPPLPEHLTRPAPAPPPPRGKIYVYAPYVPKMATKGDAVIIVGAATMLKQIASRGKPCHPVLLCHDGESKGKPLEGTARGDTVYVTAHGNSSRIGTEGKGVSLSPAQLAKLLEQDGMHPGIAKLKLTVCNSATADSDDTPYAKTLCVELFKLGYVDLMVYGYIGAVSNDAKNRNTVDFNGTPLRGKEGKRGFKGKDGDEQET